MIQMGDNYEKFDIIFSIINSLNIFSAQQNNSKINDFFEAVEKGDLKKVEDFIASGIDINSRNEDGDTPLIAAPREFRKLVPQRPFDYLRSNANLLKVINFLIEKNADVNAVSKMDQFTPLYLATDPLLKSEIIIKKLLDKGANPNYDFSVPKNISYNTFFKAIFPSFTVPPILPNKEYIKLFLLYGANFKNEKIQNELNRPDRAENKKIFEEAKAAVIKEYKDKLDQYITKVKAELQRYNIPALSQLMTEYSNYNDEQILDNIIEIRKMLGELPEHWPNQHQQDLPDEQRAAAAGAAAGKI